jgi:hypothetical protein
MIDKEPGWKTVLRINLRFVGAGLALTYGWVCWQIASKEYWGFGLIAFLAAIGGTISLLGALFEALRTVKRWRKVDQFTQKGVDARADKMADARALKDQGVTR